jgi:hypothetical protein
MDGYGQDNLHEASMIQRLALYATLGLLLTNLGYTGYSEVFWCMLGLMWCAEHLARVDGYDSAMAEADRLVLYAQQLLDRAEQLSKQQQQEQTKQ